MKKIILMLLFAFSHAEAHVEGLALSTGISVQRIFIGALESEDEFYSFGFNTHFGYTYRRFEISASSYITFGKVDDLKYSVKGQEFTGSGNYRNVSIGPLFLYHSRLEPIEGWPIYLGIGPSWSLQTVKLDSDDADEDQFSVPEDQFKLTYDSRGYTAVIGVKEELDSNELHPVFIQFAYSYKKSYKVSVVDTSDTTETNVTFVESANKDIINHTILFSMGLTLF